MTTENPENVATNELPKSRNAFVIERNALKVTVKSNVKKVRVGSDYPVVSWFIDSGASEHMVNRAEYLWDSEELDEPIRVAVAKAGVSLYATRQGTVRGHALVNEHRVRYNITGVLYVPNLEANLFSVSKAVDMNLKVQFENNVCKIIRRGKEVAVAIREHKLFELKIILDCKTGRCGDIISGTIEDKKNGGKKKVNFNCDHANMKLNSHYKQILQVL